MSGPTKNGTISLSVFASSIHCFYNAAKAFKEGAIFLKKHSNACTPSFHLLSSLAIELLPKVLLSLDICSKYKDRKYYKISYNKLTQEIAKEMHRFGHNLEGLYKYFPDLMHFLGIENIKECPPRSREVVNKRDYFVWQYDFYFSGFTIPVMIKNIEAIRYGAFATKPDVMVNCVDDDKIIDFLEKLDTYVSQKKEETRKVLLDSL